MSSFFSSPKKQVSFARSSFARLWKAEQKKAKGRLIWSLPAGFLLFETLWLLWIVQKAHPEEIYSGYLMLFYNLPLLNTILFPIMIAVISSRLCDMEIKGETLKILYTVQSRDSFFHCKYLSGIKYLLLFIIGQSISILWIGYGFHFVQPLKWSMLLSHILSTLLVSAVLLCIQQCLSLLSNNQILPMIIGLAGSFLGLFSLFFPAAVTRLVLWGYYAIFTPIVIDWDEATRISTYYETAFPIKIWVFFLLFAIFVYIFCKTIFTKKEV